MLQERWPITASRELFRLVFELSEPCAYLIVVLRSIYLLPLTKISTEFNPTCSFDDQCNRHTNQSQERQVKELSNLVFASSVLSLLAIIFIRFIRNFEGQTQPSLECNDNKHSNDGGSLKSKSSRDNDDNDDVSLSVQQRPLSAIESRVDICLQYHNSDEIGIAMGSTIGPLLILAVISHNSVVTSSNEQNLGGLYLCLLASLGLSFAISITSLSVLQLLKIQYEHERSNTTSTSVIFTIISVFLPCLSWRTWKIKFDNDNTNATDGQASASSLPVFPIAVCFAFLEILFLSHYARGDRGNSMYNPYCIFNDCGKNKQERNNDGCKSLPPTKPPSSPPLQQVFTFGEWVTVSSFLSLLLTDFLFRYCYNCNYNHHHQNNDNFQGEEISPSPPFALVPPTHDSYIAIIHGGMVGCFLGIFISLFLRSILSRLVVRLVWVLDCTMLLGKRKSRYSRDIQLWIDCLLHSTVIICMILITVDYALKQCQIFYGSNYDEEKTVSLLDIFPTRPIQWLMVFLFESNYDSLPPQTTSTNTTILPPYIWLLYWLLILLPTIIIAYHYIIQKYLVTCPPVKERRRRIVVARKFFHLVAVIMFGPPTYFAPKMMGLSYAVAFALLVLVERLRYLVQYNSFSDAEGCCSVKDCNKPILSPVYTVPSPSVEHLLTDPSHPSYFLNVNNFFRAFFDERDEGSSEGGFTVTHITLVTGCAFPLWIDNIITRPQSSQQHDYHTLQLLMPFAGIIVLGIGDAAGAVYGVRWGKTRWPGGSNRTIEGSAAVFFTMVGCSVILHWMDYWREGGEFYCCVVSTSFLLPLLEEALVVWLPLTLMEAATGQIDNFCLPLMATVLLFLFDEM